MSKKYTSLASEFHVLSTLHRLGFEAFLTLGNNKMADIVVRSIKGDLLTIDVKGIAKKYDWPADNIRAPKNGNHFIVLVSYEGELEEPRFMSNVWVVPYKKINRFIKESRKTKNVSKSLLANKGEEYLNAWRLLLNPDKG
jgi:hypothetical protein